MGSPDSRTYTSSPAQCLSLELCSTNVTFNQRQMDEHLLNDCKDAYVISFPILVAWHRINAHFGICMCIVVTLFSWTDFIKG